jgi:hypothetical protein
LAAHVVAEPPAEPAIAFLDKDAAARVMTDESIEPYFQNMQARETAAKTGEAIEADDLPAMRAIVRQRYAEATLEFTEQERDLLANGVKFVHELTKDDYPRFAAQPWRFIKLHHTIEGGLPHTRNDCIVLSDRAVQQLSFMHGQDAEAAALMTAQLLLHEQTHILQRMHPQLFTSLYEDVWGMKHVDAIEPHPALLEQQILNPDGVDTRWIFPIGKDEHRRWIQPNIMLAEGEGVPRMPRDFRLVAVEVEEADGRWQVKVNENDEPIVYPLNQFADYREALGGVGNNYHPNEALASAFPSVVLWDKMNAERGIHRGKTQGLTDVEAWAKKALAMEDAAAEK